MFDAYKPCWDDEPGGWNEIVEDVIHRWETGDVIVGPLGFADDALTTAATVGVSAAAVTAGAVLLNAHLKGKG